ncbi:MAG TPA: hypothetical protein VFM51_04260, partial [Solirubrobacterales bacterium]|nr:hypothetical protein [Solirubrobacterales bacterium]
EHLPEFAPTVVANMTAPILTAVATQLAEQSRGRGRTRRSLPSVATEGPPPPPQTLVLSGLLPGEQDDVAEAFGGAGMIEADRRQQGDWAALLLRRS